MLGISRSFFPTRGHRSAPFGNPHELIKPDHSRGLVLGVVNFYFRLHPNTVLSQQ